jgi:hypothetical protein
MKSLTGPLSVFHFTGSCLRFGSTQILEDISIAAIMISVNPPSLYFCRKLTNL